ncbi:MAG: LeuD/DmdB family oxidoreductase small subunit [Thermoplasmatota archaeon]
MDSSQLVTGKVLRLGDHIDTDVVIPARFMQAYDRLGAHVFEGLGPDYPKRAAAARILLAGRNFGCGSSREQAVMAIAQAGIRVIVAKSFARIFYRNAVNLALPLLEGEVDVADGAELEVNVLTGRIVEKASGRSFETRPLPAEARAIVDAGGLVEYLKKRIHS